MSICIRRPHEVDSGLVRRAGPVPKPRRYLARIRPWPSARSSPPRSPFGREPYRKRNVLSQNAEDFRRFGPKTWYSHVVFPYAMSSGPVSGKVINPLEQARRSFFL